jgi:hypothetical protein
MIEKLNKHITDCLDQAAEAERRAAELVDSALQTRNERMSQMWRHLARSYQFVESLQRFLLDEKTRAPQPPDAPHSLPPMVLDPETLAVLSAAYDKARDGQPAAVCETIATHILELAAEGERDPDRLCQEALALSIRGPRLIG